MNPAKIRHVAIIMDGNTRWAKSRMMPSAYGHRTGLRTVKNIIQEARRNAIESLSLFALSSENWRRPQKEINQLMSLFKQALDDEVPELHKNNARISFVGDKSILSAELKAKMKKTEELTRHNNAIRINIAVNYGGQWDIVNACRQLAMKVRQGDLEPQAISVPNLAKHLCLADQPPIDLCIRTGNEKRISNFFLWQLAYTELYFSPVAWPDFKERNFRNALQAYQKRSRRFGDSSNR